MLALPTSLIIDYAKIGENRGSVKQVASKGEEQKAAIAANSLSS
jgi:hypothetical protein